MRARRGPVPTRVGCRPSPIWGAAASREATGGREASALAPKTVLWKTVLWIPSCEAYLAGRREAEDETLESPARTTQGADASPWLAMIMSRQDKIPAQSEHLLKITSSGVWFRLRPAGTPRGACNRSPWRRSLPSRPCDYFDDREKKKVRAPRVVNLGANVTAGHMSSWRNACDAS